MCSRGRRAPWSKRSNALSSHRRPVRQRRKCSEALARLRAALKAESDRGGLTHLLLYSATAIPVFYCFALFVNRDSHITMADYWRWWLIHLWVEGMFEVFGWW